MVDTLSKSSSEGAVMSAQTGQRWHAYAEQRELTDKGRRADGRDERLERTPDAVLSSPEEVASWMSAQTALLTKKADAEGRSWNALSGDRGSISRGTAAKGRSVYSTVRLSTTTTVDLCAEVVL